MERNNKEFINTIRNNNYSGRLNLYHTKSKKVDLTERYMRKSKNYFKPRISQNNENVIIERTPHGKSIKYLKDGVRVRIRGGRNG